MANTTYYPEFYARLNLGTEEAVIPRQGNLFSSPDIQPVGTSPITDPQEYFIGQKSDEYRKDKGTNIVGSRKNYIYIRDSTAKACSGHVELYYVPSSLVMNPIQWKKNQLRGRNGNTQIPFKAGRYQD